MSENLEPIQDDQEEVEVADIESNETETAEEAEADTAEEAEGDEESESSDDEPPKPKKRSRAEERINALTREKYEAQKAAEQAQRQIAEMQQYMQQFQQPNVGNDIPKLADYDYDETAYNQAIHQWHSQQIQTIQDQQEQQRQMAMHQAEMQRQSQALQAKMAEGTKKYADFAEKVNDPNLPPLREINPAAFQAVMDSENGIDVAYYLANNPGEVYALASMTPYQAIRQVAQLEHKLNSKPAQVKVPGKPPSRLNGNSDTQKDPEKMSTSEWLAWRNAQLNSQQR